MKEVTKKLLLNYMESNVCPILVENISSNSFKNYVLLDSNCDVSLLNGHYEGVDFVAPNWYLELIEKSKKGNVVLFINGINEVSINDQCKFIEIFKYRKISTFDLPRNCVVVASCSSLKDKAINEEVYSLMAHIEG